MAERDGRNDDSDNNGDIDRQVQEALQRAQETVDVVIEHDPTDVMEDQSVSNFVSKGCC